MKRRILAALLAVCMMTGIMPLLGISAEEEDAVIVKDGLVAHYDGAMNTENGHDANATVWQDLAGDNDITLAKNATNYFTENAFHLSRAQYNLPKALLNLVNGNAFTVEFSIGEFTLHGSGYATLLNNDNNDNFSLFIRKSNDVLEFKNGGNGRPMVTAGSDAIRNSTVSVTFEKGKACRIYIDGICQAQTVPSSTIGAAGNLFFGHADDTRSHTTDYEQMRFYNRALTEEEVIQNAVADGHYDEDYVPPMPFVEVKQPKTNIIGDIAFIEELKNASMLDSYAEAAVPPATLIMKVDATLTVKAEDGASIGTLADVLAKIEGIMPAFAPTDAEAAATVAAYLNEIQMEDAFVVSSDPTVIKTARDGCGMLRGVLDVRKMFNGKTPDEKTLLTLRSTVNRASCRIAILPYGFSDSDVIDTLSDLQITTWIESEEDAGVTEMLSNLLSGAYGILSQNTASYYNVAKNMLAENTLTRTLLNVGHRGYPGGTYPENSLQGAIEAYEKGADAIESDIYLTKDNQIVICHDGNTNAMFDKNISVEGSTLAQLRALNFKGTNMKMPTLEEFFSVFKDKDVLMVIEIKSSKPAIVTELKKLIDEYDMYGKCYVIAYYKSAIYKELLAVMPEMPIGFLTGDAVSGVGADTLRHPLETVLPYNATWNPNYGGYTAEFTRNAVLRGLMTSPYTINDANTLYTYLSYGHTALTTNYCNIIGALDGKITLKTEAAEVVSSESSLPYTVSATTWARSERDVTAKASLTVLEGGDLVSIENGQLTFGKGEGTVVLLASYTTKMGNIPYTLYDQPIVIEVKADQTPDQPSDEQPPAGDGSSPVIDNNGNAGSDDNADDDTVIDNDVTDNDNINNEGGENNDSGSKDPQKDEGSSLTLIIVIAAIGVLAIGAGLFIFLKKRSDK